MFGVGHADLKLTDNWISDKDLGVISTSMKLQT